MRKNQQMQFKGVSGWGGKRRGAGRPNLSGTVAHAKREAVNFNLPLHITMALSEGIATIRRPGVLKLFKNCVQAAARFEFHILHFSIQSNHVHIIAEARNNKALARGMQSLASSFAKKLKERMNAWGDPITGAVFKARYHLRTIGNPTQMKHTLKYVLLNTAKHLDMIEHVDRFSSAAAFTQWRALLGSRFRGLIAEEGRRPPVDLGLAAARSWLARGGWKRAWAG